MVNLEPQVTLALEKKAVDINIDGNKKRVSTIEAEVYRVSGYGNFLQIQLDETEYGIRMIKFNGSSPIRKGDKIKAGLIVEQEFPKEAILIGIYEEMYPKFCYNKTFSRIDYMKGYDPLHEDMKRLGID